MPKLGRKMYEFEELDEITRKWMLNEYLKEESSSMPYRSNRLTELGGNVFPKEMERAIREGNEESLAKALSESKYWLPSETYERNGKICSRRINPISAAQFLANTEFNTWYTRGFARRLIEEGQEDCQVVRVAQASNPRNECSSHENKKYKVQDIYKGHRVRYWPPPGIPDSFSIPSGTNCHHSIKRISKSNNE